MADAFNLAGYLARVGLDPTTVALQPPTAETLAAVMLAQSRAIAFENLDVVLGKPISIEPAVIEQQLVQGGRGG
jgi:N-hydroxyarylamine O-acetyltransferase